MLFELFVLDVVELFCALVTPAALPATSDCALCCSCCNSEEATDEVLEALVDALLCNAEARSPALVSNCCRLMLLPPPESCENTALACEVLPVEPVAWL